ncbi:MAG: L-2-amino-thiazoline-4-carboxylic acid hydrolase [Candidatus Heimdallarchaeota archaeon]
MTNGSDDFIEQMKQYFHILTNNFFKGNFGEEQGELLHKRYLEEFNRLFSRNFDIMPDHLSKRHGINSIFVMAYNFAADEMNLSFEELKNQIISIYRIMLHDIYEQQKRNLIESDNPLELFKENVKKGNKSLYDNEYFQLEYVPENDKIVIGFNLHRCIYFEIFEKNGQPELGPILCEYDYLLADAVKNWVTFERTETIADGFKCCNFRFLYKQNEIHNI